MTTSTSKKPTVASLASEVADLKGGIAQILASLQGQHATAAPVAEAVSLKKEKVEPVVVKSASDQAYEFVQSKGLAFARGGRTTLSTEALKAAVAVLKTGTPVVITQEGLGSLDKRKITGVCLFRSDDGKAVVTQYVFTPEA